MIKRLEHPELDDALRNELENEDVKRKVEDIMCRILLHYLVVEFNNGDVVWFSFLPKDRVFRVQIIKGMDTETIISSVIQMDKAIIYGLKQIGGI